MMISAITFVESMDERLGWILVAAWILVFLVVVAGAALEIRVERLIKIQRASHELLKQMLAEMKKEIPPAPPEMPRRYDITKQQRSNPPDDAPGTPKVYRID
jgi:hypothetical protein